MGGWAGGHMRQAGIWLLALVVFVALAAPWLAPNDPERRFDDLLYAPPSSIHFGDADNAGLHTHGWRLINRLERTFAEDPAVDGPLLLLGADAYGRDNFSRLLYGTRVSLALAVIATLIALLIGSMVGAMAGYAGGWLDELLSRGSDMILVLPATYVVLALRAVMPLVLPGSTVFLLLAGIFALVGSPIVARGVRGIVVAEREREYVQAARALGAGGGRIVLRHLLPSARGHVLTQGTLLLPAFVVAEATLSYVGLGFPASVPTWGTMLQEATTGSLLAEAPWMLAPAAAIFIVVLAVNLVVQGSGRAPVQLES